MKIAELIIGETYQVEWMPTVWPYIHTGKLIRKEKKYIYFDANQGDNSFVPVRINCIKSISYHPPTYSKNPKD